MCGFFSFLRGGSWSSPPFCLIFFFWNLATQRLSGTWRTFVTAPERIVCLAPPPPFCQGRGGGGGKGWGKGGRNGVKGKSPRAAVPVYFEWSHLSIDGRNQTVEKNYFKKKKKEK